MCAFLATEVNHYFIECTVEKEKKKVTELLRAATGQMSPLCRTSVAPLVEISFWGWVCGVDVAPIEGGMVSPW